MEGDEVVAVLMLAPGPAALAPAQVTQFSHPLILCIWLLTVWADERSEAAAKRNSATARMETLLVVFFTITTFTPGVFLGFFVPRDF
jgi:nitrogen fixation/metabolism regulation signal transduction histidine kinase